MNISRLYELKKTVFSLEIFPPKPEYPLDSIYETLERLKGLYPDFISVTYGAGGSSRERTVEISSQVKNKYSIETLSHLTCVCSSKAETDIILEELFNNGITNILALRGDIPYGFNADKAFNNFRYAYDLVSFIKSKNKFCIGATAYPEGHLESENTDVEISYLKMKVEAGTDFLITQLCFDNNIILDYIEKIRAKGINIPVSVGIMPVINANQIKRITSLCGASIPTVLERLIMRYGGTDMERAGIDYASWQINQLRECGIQGIHLYTMNKAEQIRKILKNTGL